MDVIEVTTLNDDDVEQLGWHLTFWDLPRHSMHDLCTYRQAIYLRVRHTYLKINTKV